MKVVITGAHGKVGRAATQALVDAGHKKKKKGPSVSDGGPHRRGRSVRRDSRR